MARKNYIREIWKGKKCVLCGGGRDAQNVEHAPPKIIFRNKQRPKGLEVPACDRCNHSASEAEQLVAFIALSQAPDAVSKKNTLSEHDLKVVRGVVNNSPFLYDDAQRVPVFSSAGQLEKVAWRISLRPVVQKQLAAWAAKQTLAMWYKHTSKIASPKVLINIKLMSNAMKAPDGLDEILATMGPLHSLDTARNITSNQFSYKAEVDALRGVGSFAAQYHGGFGFVSTLNDNKTSKISKRRLDFSFGLSQARGIYMMKS